LTAVRIWPAYKGNGKHGGTPGEGKSKLSQDKMWSLTASMRQF
jgi:hypothetical protein